jgi:hypothetical protein
MKSCNRHILKWGLYFGVIGMIHGAKVESFLIMLLSALLLSLCLDFVLSALASVTHKMINIK